MRNWSDCITSWSDHEATWVGENHKKDEVEEDQNQSPLSLFHLVPKELEELEQQEICRTKYHYFSLYPFDLNLTY